MACAQGCAHRCAPRFCCRFSKRTGVRAQGVCAGPLCACLCADPSVTLGVVRTWSDPRSLGWRVAADVEGVRRTGVLVRLSPEEVHFRDEAGELWRVSRVGIEVLGPPTE